MQPCNISANPAAWAVDKWPSLNLHSTFAQPSFNLRSTFAQPSLNLHWTFTQPSLNLHSTYHLSLLCDLSVKQVTFTFSLLWWYNTCSQFHGAIFGSKTLMVYDFHSHKSLVTYSWVSSSSNSTSVWGIASPAHTLYIYLIVMCLLYSLHCRTVVQYENTYVAWM